MPTYYHGSGHSALKRINPRTDKRTGRKGVYLSDTFHGAAIHSLMPNREKHSVNYRTNKGKLVVGRVVSKEPLRKKAYVYEVKVPKKAVKKAPQGGLYVTSPLHTRRRARVDRDKYLSSNNWHHVQTNKLYYGDKKRARGWIYGQRIHHGAYAWGIVGLGAAAHLKGKQTTGKALIKTGKYLIKDDKKDALIWFERGPQYQGTEVFRKKRRIKRKGYN